MASVRDWSAIAALAHGLAGHACLVWGAAPGVAVVDALANEGVADFRR
jgi:hypothetical protein